MLLLVLEGTESEQKKAFFQILYIFRVEAENPECTPPAEFNGMATILFTACTELSTESAVSIESFFFYIYCRHYVCKICKKYTGSHSNCTKIIRIYV